MKRYKLIIAYDGTSYCGWQIQNNGISIQSLIEGALETVLRHKTDIHGSGRTDAGVHARGQVAHFNSSLEIDPKRLLFSLNALLPSDIRILSLTSVALDFHSRYSAVKKTYHYHIHLDPVADPFISAYRYQIFDRLDLEALKAATQLFVGTHDFTSFANDALHGSAAKNPIRTLHRFDLIQQAGGYRFELEGNGFLYKMVRNLVGTVLEVAKSKRKLEDLPALIAAKDRRKSGASAPPQALFLMHVDY